MEVAVASPSSGGVSMTTRFVVLCSRRTAACLESFNALAAEAWVYGGFDIAHVDAHVEYCVFGTIPRCDRGWQIHRQWHRWRQWGTITDDGAKCLYSASQRWIDFKHASDPRFCPGVRPSIFWTAAGHLACLVVSARHPRVAEPNPGDFAGVLVCCPTRQATTRTCAINSLPVTVMC